MANILPPDRLKHLRKGQRARLLFAVGAVTTTLGLIALIALLPSFLAVRLGPHASSVENNIQTATSTRAVSEAQNLVTVLQPLLATTTTSVEAMRIAIAQKPSGIQIDRIEYSRSAGLGTIVLGVTARSASDIDAYRTRLTADGHFTQVSVPVSALAGASNGRFAITLSGRF